MIVYVIPSVIEKIEEKQQIVSTTKDGETSIEKLGWFVLLQGSSEMLFLGMEKPDLEKGQNVNIKIEPR